MICWNCAHGQASALSCTQHPHPQPNGSNLRHLTPASWPGDSLIRRRYRGGVAIGADGPKDLRLSEQMQSMEKEFPLRWSPCIEYNGAASGSSCAQREEAGIGKQRCAAGRSRRAEAGRSAAILCNCCCPNSGCRACILASLWRLQGLPVFGT